MNWLTPGLAGLAAAVTIPSLLILYFLKLRRRDVEVSSTLLWKKSIQDLQANAPFQRLRKNILLLLQLLALAFGLLAIAQPVMDAPQGDADRVVLVIDRSASMSAVEGEDGRTRLDRAKADALAYVDSMSEGTVLSEAERQEAMLIVFDASAEVALPFTSNKPRLRAAIGSIEPTDAPSDISQAMRLARAHVDVFRENVGLMPGAPVVIWTDGRVDGTEDVQLHPETDVRYRRVGEAGAENVAITSMRVTRAFDDPQKASVFIAMQNASDRPREVLVEFGVNGSVAAARARTLPPRGEDGRPVPSGVVFELDTPDRAILAASLDIRGGDALEADNLARVYLPAAEQLRVAVVSTGNLFLQTALEGMPVRMTTLTPDEFEAQRASAELDRYDVFVMDGWMPVLDEADRGDGPSLPPGRYLLFGEIPSMRGLTPGPGGKRDEPAIVTSTERDHPVMRLAAFESVVMASTIDAEVTSESTILADTSSGPGIIEATDGPVKVIATAFGAAESSWPFDTGFVLFLASAVEYLGGDGGDITVGNTLPGGTLTTRLPSGARNVDVITPSGASYSVNPSSDGRISFGPIPNAGLYEVTWEGPPGPRDPVIDGKPRRPVPVNLFDPEESSLEVRESLPLVTGVSGQSVGGGEGGPGEVQAALWKYGLLALLAMLMLEWYVYNRKVHL